MAEEKSGSGGLDWDAAFPDTGESGASSGGGSGGKGWVEGDPIGPKMSKKAARAEIKNIESHPDFLDKEDKAAYWPRQRMLRRRDALYRLVGVEGPAPGMEETLVKQGVTPEWLEAEQEKFADRDWKEEIKKSRQALELHFGGEKAAEEAIKAARSVVKRFGKPADLKFLEDSGLGSDPELIKILVNLDQILKKGRKKR